jgi:glycosyltransferase involved in cell wall biosynthesis
MAAGAPVITSNRSSLPEVGGDAVEYADPTEVASIAAALERVLESPERRAALSQASRRRAAQFTWAKTADIVLGALEGAARPRQPREGTRDLRPQ